MVGKFSVLLLKPHADNIHSCDLFVGASRSAPRSDRSHVPIFSVVGKKIFFRFRSGKSRCICTGCASGTFRSSVRATSSGSHTKRRRGRKRYRETIRTPERRYDVRRIIPYANTKSHSPRGRRRDIKSKSRSLIQRNERRRRQPEQRKSRIKSSRNKERRNINIKKSGR